MLKLDFFINFIYKSLFISLFYRGNVYGILNLLW